MIRDLLGPTTCELKLNGFNICERGISCRKNDVKGFANGLKYLIQDDINERNERLSLSRSFVETKYSKEQLIHDMENLYIGLIEKRHFYKS